MRAHKAKTVEIAKNVMHTNQATTSEIYDEVIPMFNLDGHFDPKALAALSQSWVELKTLPKAPDLHTLYTNAFLPKR